MHYLTIYKLVMYSSGIFHFFYFSLSLKTNDFKTFYFALTLKLYNTTVNRKHSNSFLNFFSSPYLINCFFKRRIRKAIEYFSINRN